MRYVNDWKYWTSAGVSGGIDMSLAIIDDLLGRKYTEALMLDLEYNPKPPYNAGIPQKIWHISCGYDERNVLYVYVTFNWKSESKDISVLWFYYPFWSKETE